MGMIRCETHGLRHIKRCCSHVGDAIDHADPKDVAVVIDDWGEPFVVCGLCKMKHDDEMTAPVGDGPRYSITGTGEPYCSDCLALWRDFSRDDV
jgi:hypothetical protein